MFLQLLILWIAFGGSRRRMAARLALIIVLCSTFSVVGAFNCLRKGQTCKNIQPCNKGVCACVAPYGGYNCDVNNDLIIPSSQCDPACINGGLCLKEQIGPRCSCTKEYYGAACEVSREDGKCLGDSKVIHLNPEGFVGTMYITDNRKEACTFKPASTFTEGNDGYDAKWTEGWTLVVPDTGVDCGDIESSADGTNTTLRRYVNIEYNPDLVTHLDKKLTMTCIQTNGEIRPLPETFMDANIGPDSYQTTTIEKQYGPVGFSAVSNGQPVGSAQLLIGVDLLFEFFIPSSTGYEKLIVVTLGASDGVDGGKTVSIIDQKCQTDAGDAIIKTTESLDAGRRIKLTMKVFKFVTSGRIVFTANIRICLPGETECDQPTCPPPPARKRRSSGNQKEVIKDIRVTEDPAVARAFMNLTEQCRDNPYISDDNLCLKKNDIIAVMVTMAAALVILIIACIVLTVKLWSPRPKTVESSSSCQLPVILPRLSPSNF